jgi:hypothetical protein
MIGNGVNHRVESLYDELSIRSVVVEPGSRKIVPDVACWVEAGTLVA